jgi:hypothetical protein
MMGRNKKEVVVDREKLGSMSNADKLKLIGDCNQLFYYELSRIPYSELEVSERGKAESIAEAHYRNKGFQVYRSKINNGYRSIGVEFYWEEFKNKISESDERLIQILKGLLSPQDFEELANMVQEKNGTPDLLLIKNATISFVEVKYNYETVKSSTVEFYLRYGHKWPISILRIIRKHCL